MSTFHVNPKKFEPIGQPFDTFITLIQAGFAFLLYFFLQMD